MCIVVGRPPLLRLCPGEGPVVTVATHSGHAVSPHAARALALDPDERLREEDPFTEAWAFLGDWKVVGLRSRFEVDLNRPREQAVYRSPEESWGLQVWKGAPDPDLLLRSRREHDDFYGLLLGLFRKLERAHGRFLVLDLHSYNHRRDGSEADPRQNPEVNIGTGTMVRERWSREVDRFMEELRTFDFGGRRLDVRENVRFKGGFLALWTHSNFPTTGCVLSVEVKKFFMDEWTGQVDLEPLGRVGEALGRATQAIRDDWRERGLLR